MERRTSSAARSHWLISFLAISLISGLCVGEFTQAASKMAPALPAEAKKSSPPTSSLMIPIAIGPFMMGGAGWSYEVPIHSVHLTKPFAIMQHETTFGEYDVFAQATGRPLPSDEGWGRGARPVVNVSWEDAQAYAQWVSQQTGKHYRLPTEAEWEYAARSGGRDESWAGTSVKERLTDYAVYGRGRFAGGTESVGSKKPNGLGLFDMSGNVWEWVDDCWHGDYNGAPIDGSAWGELNGGDCTRRVIRGGSWVDGPDTLRVSYRFKGPVDYRNINLGFRLVQDLN